jgi:cell division protein FtsI (penicillin-binding protein 3)
VAEAETPTFVWRATLKRRVLVAVVLLLAWAVGIEARLAYLQLARHPEMTARAERQQLRTVETTAKRGDILDRNGHVMAYSVEADSVYAVPTEIEDPAAAAAALCRALEDCSARDREALAERIRRGRAFVYVRRQVSPDQARRVAALELEGVGFMKENRRFYPNKELAAHVVGYVGIDNTGLSGLEAAYDHLINGRTGTVLVQTDARRRAFSRIERPPTTGATLELTIDRYLQHVVERELRVGVEENRAAGGSALIMDPRTGEILALANWPTFNPNAYRNATPEAQRNRAVQDLYEPGSTFKIVTASAALEERVVTPDEPIDVSDGLIRFGRRVIEDTHRYGVLSFADVVVMSSNVGAVKVGLRLGPERLGLFTSRFGFGRRTSPLDFPGESAGIVWNPSKLNDSALASVSMGYQVGVTPLQMAAAVSSIANGGELLEPRIVRAVIQDGKRTPVPHKVVRRTVTASTAALLTHIMEQVVERGTGLEARVPGFAVAGKTGTAQKLVDGRYSRTEYNASFVGFAPSRQPEFVIVVVVDSPHGRSYFGGSVAAPIFRRIAEAGLQHRGMPSSINTLPPVLVDRRGNSNQPLRTSGPVSLRVDVAGQDPGSSRLLPDLRGLGARDAMKELTLRGITARVVGDGIVVGQQPPPGSPIEPGATATLTLERRISNDASPLSAMDSAQ